METINFGEPKHYDGNAKQKILKLLADTKFLLRKEQIATKIGHPIPYVAKCLSELTRAGLVHESKGKYNITPNGRAAVEEDEHLSSIMFSKSRENGLIIQLPWDFINTNGICRNLIENKHLLKEDSDLSNYFVPMIVYWLLLNGYNIPSSNKEIKEIGRDLRLAEVYKEFLNKLRYLE